MAVEIHAFLWDDANEAHVAKHGIAPRELNQLIENPHIVVRNRKRRRAPLMVIGRTHGGRVLCVPIQATREPDVWRPVTAYSATDAQMTQLDKHS